MIVGKLAWFIAVQFTIFKGSSCSNTTQGGTIEDTTPQTTLPGETLSIIYDSTQFSEVVTTTPTTNNSTGANETHLEILEIFEGDANTTAAAPPTEQIIVNATTNCHNISLANLVCSDQSWNKTNYTTVAEAVATSEDLPEFRLQNTAAIAAGIFLVSAVIGYFSCVGYRRFLQRKYGNSQILIGEEVYDTTDLRYFEI